MKLEIENFRVFKENTSLEIRPLTILIGPNNSGKSSFTKFLLLLKNGWETLNFNKKGHHNLVSFSKSLNWNSNSKKLKVSFPTDSLIPHFSSYRGEIVYQEDNNNGKIEKLSLFDNLISFNLVPKQDDIYIGNNESYDVSFDMNEIIKLSIQELEKIIVFHNNRFKNLDLFNKKEVAKILEKLKPDNVQYKEEIRILRCAKVYHELNSEQNEILLYDVLIDNVIITESHKKEIIELQTKHLRVIKGFELSDFTGWTFSNILEKFPLSIIEGAKQEIASYFKNEYPNAEIKVVESSIGNIIFKEKLFTHDNRDEHDMSFFEYAFNYPFGFLESCKIIKYVPAQRGNQQRVYQNKTYNSDINTQYIRKQNSTDPNDLLLKIMGSDKSEELFKEILEILKIDGKLRIETFEDAVSTIYIINEEKQTKFNLADFGFGYSQLIPILLNIYNLGTYSSGILIIEEPEANLHPNLQSKLADIFVAVIKYCPKLKLVIETHSEYLIRKLQYLVAKKEITKDKCVINYFNSDENVSKYEPKVKTIEITENGDLTDNFGPGFFDESTMLQFELMKLNKSQLN